MLLTKSCFLRNHASYEVILYIIYCITQGAPGKLFFGKSSGFVKKCFHKISVRGRLFCCTDTEILQSFYENRCAFQHALTCQNKKPEKFRSILFKGLWVSRGLKPLFSFALCKGKTWSFSLPVGATGIFKRPLRGLKTAKTPA